MFDWLFPQTIETVSSLVNGPIRVVRSGTSTSLHVAGYEQSGRIVEKIWAKTLSKLSARHYKKILILGLGGGTVAHLEHVTTGMARAGAPRARRAGDYSLYWCRQAVEEIRLRQAASAPEASLSTL